MDTKTKLFKKQLLRPRIWAVAGVVAVIIGGITNGVQADQSLLGQAAAEAKRALNVNKTTAPAETKPDAPADSPSEIKTDSEQETAQKNPEPEINNTIQSAQAGSALQVLATLPVKGRAPKTGYDRKQFGQRWRDLDRNGCDQRNDILGRDLGAVKHKPGTRGCVVTSGVLADPFSGTTIEFTRGNKTSSQVQIDHVVALSDAWQKGAQQISAADRERLANDPLNLLAVSGRLNAQKSDGDAATWLPPNKAFRCSYVARQIAVKKRYSLWVTSAEREAMERILNRCPGQKLPTFSGPAWNQKTTTAGKPVVLAPNK